MSAALALVPFPRVASLPLTSAAAARLGRQYRPAGRRLDSNLRRLGQKVGHGIRAGPASPCPHPSPRHRRRAQIADGSIPEMVSNKPEALKAHWELLVPAAGQPPPVQARKWRPEHARARLRAEQLALQKRVRRRRLWPWACGCAGAAGRLAFLGAGAASLAEDDESSFLGGRAMREGNIRGARARRRGELGFSAGRGTKLRGVDLDLEKGGRAVIPHDPIGEFDFSRQRQLLGYALSGEFARETALLQSERVAAPENTPRIR